jgi:hypothetical protein
LRLSGGHTSLQQLKTAENHCQQVIEVMCDATRELPDGFHLLRLNCPLAGFFEHALRFPPFSEVARDFRVSD